MKQIKGSIIEDKQLPEIKGGNETFIIKNIEINENKGEIS